jgi:hypothetical protein
MGALTLFDISSNKLGVLATEDGWISRDGNNRPPWVHPDGRSQDKNPEGLKPLGVIAIANAIPDMGAISSVNLLNNDIPMEQAKALAGILKEHLTLKSLCGNSGDEIKLDMSRQQIGAGGAIMLAPEIAGNGVISSVNLLKNDIPVEQAQELVKIMQSKEKLSTLCGLSGEEATLDFSNQELGPGDAVLIANDISNMGALTSLNLSANDLKAEGAKIVAEAIKVTIYNYAAAVVLAPFSYAFG